MKLEVRDVLYVWYYTCKFWLINKHECYIFITDNSKNIEFQNYIKYPRSTLSIAFPLRVLSRGANHIIQIYSGITCSRVLNGELYT